MSDIDKGELKHDATGQTADQVEEAAAAWFVRLRSGRCSVEERQAFESWRTRHPAHAAAFEAMARLWEDSSLHAAAMQAGCDARPIPPGRRAARWHLPWMPRMAAAAAVTGLVAGAALLLDLPLRLVSDYRTAAGERHVVRLSDRSTVTLNTQSALGEAFDAKTRRVHLLKGEAFFQVAHDREKAFVVESRRITTRAVGTEFVVREEPDGIRVTVVGGVVELAPARPGWAPIQLAAGQQVAVGPHGPGLVRDVDLKLATAWLRGRLVVDGERLADVIAELGRYYPGTIQVWNRAAGEIRVSGSYSLDDPAGILASLVRTLPVRMVRVTDRAVILF